MSTPLLDRRWPWLTAAALMIVLVVLFTFVEVRFGTDFDRRRTGSVDDIAELRDRTDTNVLFILIDTLRSDRLGSYGYERPTSPELDRLASTGVRFSHHLAQSSWTKCSMASLWTGMYPTRTGVTRFDHVLPDAAQMPAEILRDAGFRTAGIYRNGWVAPNFGFGQGFDVYVRPVHRRVDRRVIAENPTIKMRGTDEDAISSAIEFLRIHGHERWFLYLHLMDVHEYLYDEETALFGGTYSDIYDNSIRWVNDAIAVLMAHLAEHGYGENTLVVINADHGEAFRERGIEGHARRVFKESTEVPFLLSFPFQLEPGVVVDARTRNVDVWPTVLDLIGLEAPPGIDGRSLLPDILASARGEDPPAPAPAGVAHLDQTWGQRGVDPEPTVAVAEGSLRYVRSGRVNQTIEQLFDFERDPRELEDRAAAEPDEVERLRAIADAYLEESPPWGDAPVRDMDELELNQLRALGYSIP